MFSRFKWLQLWGEDERVGLGGGRGDPGGGHSQRYSAFPHRIPFLPVPGASGNRNPTRWDPTPALTLGCTSLLGRSWSCRSHTGHPSALPDLSPDGGDTQLLRGEQPRHPWLEARRPCSDFRASWGGDQSERASWRQEGQTELGRGRRGRFASFELGVWP